MHEGSNPTHSRFRACSHLSTCETCQTHVYMLMQWLVRACKVGDAVFHLQVHLQERCCLYHHQQTTSQFPCMQQHSESIHCMVLAHVGCVVGRRVTALWRNSISMPLYPGISVTDTTTHTRNAERDMLWLLCSHSKPLPACTYAPVIPHSRNCTPMRRILGFEEPGTHTELRVLFDKVGTAGGNPEHGEPRNASRQMVGIEIGQVLWLE